MAQGPGQGDEPPDMAAWMAGLPDSTPLGHVTMPGTHNSTSFAIDPGQLGIRVSALASRCQGWDLPLQFRHGIRFLDVRTRPDGALCHGRIGCGTLTLGGALRTCGTFLRAHPSEVLLVRVKDEGSSKASACAVDSLVHELVESAEYPVYLQMRLPTVGEVRGRIVLLRDWADGLYGLPWDSEYLRIQDEYWQSTGTGKWRVVERHLRQAGPSPDLLQVHFTSATSLPRKVPITIARSVNPKLACYLRSTIRNRFLGVVVMDFPSASLCELLVQRNERFLDPCRCLGALGRRSPVEKGYLSNLQCELMAAATRADLQAEDEAPSERLGRVHWLVRVYIKLVVERAEAELCDPAIGPYKSAFGLSAGPPSRGPEPRSAAPRAPPRKRSALYKFGACFSFRGQRNGEAEQHPVSVPAPRVSEASPFPPDWLETLHCEFMAAASKADAAALTSPNELQDRVQWLSRVFVRFTVDSTEIALRARRARAAELADGGEGTSDGSASELDDSDADGSGSGQEEDLRMPSKPGTCGRTAIPPIQQAMMGYA